MPDGGFAADEMPGRFADPFSYRVNRAMADIAAWLVADAPAAPTTPSSLEDLCRLQAVQDDTPSSALEIFFALKPALRAELKSGRLGEADYRALDARADALVLHAIDCFAQCRDDIGQLRIDEIRRKEKLLLRRVDAARRFDIGHLRVSEVNRKEEQLLRSVAAARRNDEKELV